jgi:hypothetical protein
MRRSRLAVTLVGLVLLPASPAAQQKPDFSGLWVVVAPADGAGTEQRITHDLKANTLMLAHDSEGQGHRIVYKLDGTESRNALASHGSEIVMVSKAQWIGAQIAIRSVTAYPDGRRMESKQVWSLDASGQLIVAGTETIDNKTTTIQVVHKKR